MRFLHKDFLILPGGADINPKLYNKKNYKSHIGNYTDTIDSRHIEEYNKAVKEGRPIFGICRGLQLLSALNGLTLIQDMSHPGQHSIKVKDINTNLFTKEIAVNNIHHQCVWTENKLIGDNFEVYGFCSLSKKHHYQEDEQIQCEFEPEIIWFPKVKALGVQFHPEMMDNMLWKDTISYLEKLVNKLF